MSAAGKAVILEQRLSRLENEVFWAGHPSLPDFLDWIGDRLANHYKENPNIDFVQGCHRRAKALRECFPGRPIKGRSSS